MERYANFGGDSITVSFKDGASYMYNNMSAGTGNIAQMKALAQAGQGFNEFINRYVKYGYARKLR